MYKVIWNNMVIDLLHEPCYIRYLPRQARAVVVDKGNANGVMGSDKNTMYHLYGTQSTFGTDTKTVELVAIGEAEFEALSQQQNQTQALEEKIKSLESLITQQNQLLSQIITKFDK